VSQSAPLKLRTSSMLECHLLSTNVVDLVISLLNRRGPGVLINVPMLEHCALT
jgi:hypothetical protein